MNKSPIDVVHRSFHLIWTERILRFLLILALSSYQVVWAIEATQGNTLHSEDKGSVRNVGIINAAGHHLSLHLNDNQLSAVRTINPQGLDEIEHDKLLRENGIFLLGYHGTNLEKAKKLIPFGFEPNYKNAGDTAGCSGGEGFYVALTRAVAREWSTNHIEDTDKPDPVSYKCPQNQGDAGQIKILRVYALIESCKEGAIRVYDLKKNNHPSMTSLEFNNLCEKYSNGKYTSCDLELIVKVDSTDYLVAIPADSPNIDGIIDHNRYNWGNLFFEGISKGSENPDYPSLF